MLGKRKVARGNAEPRSREPKVSARLFPSLKNAARAVRVSGRQQMRTLIVILGWFVALLPRFLAAGTASVLGFFVYALMRRRRAMMLRNLRLCFPKKTPEECRAIALESCRRMVEMGMFVLASPHFSRERILKNFSVEEKEIAAAAAFPGPTVVAVPHFSLMESLTMIPVLYPPLEKRPIGIFYRPFDNAAIETWVKNTRERWGCRLLSRKKGLTQALAFLRENGLVCVLPDQGTGAHRGALSLFFGRVATCSELAGTLAHGHPGTRTIVAWCEREGFWRGRVRVEEIAPAGTGREEVNFRISRWLERRLESSDSACADWLWMHDRWKGMTGFNLIHRHDRLAENLRFLGLDALPKKKKIFVRMPNWLGDVVMALPLVGTLRKARPDAEITLVARAHFLPMLEQLDCADALIALPAKSGGLAYWRACRSLLRAGNPEVFVLFTNSLRGDLEARLSGAPVRCGMVREGHPRPLITRVWRVPSDLDLTKNHQTLVWARWLRESCGLVAETDFSPLRLAGAGTPMEAEKPLRVGLICGSENSPEKRWSVERWRELITLLLEAFPSLEIRLFGTAKDAAVTARVAENLDASRVLDRAGKTNLPDYMGELAECRAVCGNDTGGLHLANMLGVPVIGVFGPTNPVRTGPIFDAPRTILQPEGCPPVGGASIEGVPARAAFDRLAEILRGN